jgi:hypothetical protein
MKIARRHYRRMHMGDWRPFKCPKPGCTKTFKVDGDMRCHAKYCGLHTHAKYKCGDEDCLLPFTTLKVCLLPHFFTFISCCLSDICMCPLSPFSCVHLAHFNVVLFFQALRVCVASFRKKEGCKKPFIFTPSPLQALKCHCNLTGHPLPYAI